MGELLIVLAVVFLAAAWLGRRYWRAARQKDSGCGCGCGCGESSCQTEPSACRGQSQPLESAQPPRKES